MRIREVYLHNFRCFRGRHRISFVNPVTDTVYPVSVLAGANGTGKTTILEVIDISLTILISGVLDFLLALQISDDAYVHVILELSPDEMFIEHQESDLRDKHQLIIAIGNQNLAPDSIQFDQWPHRALFLHNDEEDVHIEKYSHSIIKWREQVKEKNQTKQIEGGYVYFPQERQLSNIISGAIEPPQIRTFWGVAVRIQQEWKNSLQQFWVWQNYLDLEAGNGSHSHFKSFVETVEDVLGPNRKISIKQGQVTIPTPWYNTNGVQERIGLNQLPSGEKQCLLLFGELARHRRKHSVIMIDEVESSLHPTLQRLVMHNLRKFAREWDAQIIVATHSREVIQSVRGGAFILLDDIKEFDDTYPVESMESDA
ncbi:MAG: ATP-binding protein [Chloroflexota bacterium]